MTDPANRTAPETAREKTERLKAARQDAETAKAARIERDTRKALARRKILGDAKT